MYHVGEPQALDIINLIWFTNFFDESYSIGAIVIYTKVKTNNNDFPLLMNNRLAEDQIIKIVKQTNDKHNRLVSKYVPEYRR